MAVIAQFRCRFFYDLFLFRMDRMTAGTVDIGGIVMRKFPSVERFTLVAVYTGLCIAELVGFRGIDNQLRVGFFNMRRSGTMS